MEKLLNKKIETYVCNFKNKLRNKISGLDFEDKTKLNELYEFVNEYERLVLSKEDFIKRKRIKNSIPVMNRCNAKRASGEQCTRRRKENCEFCGTHVKGVPHGLIKDSDKASNSMQKIEVFAEEICGIVYYIDKMNNVYKTEDILEGKQNPLVVAKYVKQNDKYSIPEFGI
jgi:hypothetical protein